MDTQPVRHPVMELGVFWIVVPAVWVVAAFAGLALLVNRPDLFADPAQQQVGGAASVATASPVNASPVNGSPAHPVGAEPSAVMRTSVSLPAPVKPSGR